MKEQLQADMKSAMKDKDKVKLTTIRSLMSALQYQEMQSDTPISDETILATIKNELKQRKESLEFAEKDNREDEVSQLKTEIQIIENYLPSQMSEEQLSEIIKTFLDKNAGANIGQIMGHLKANYAGQYDGKLASTLAKDLS